MIPRHTFLYAATAVDKIIILCEYFIFSLDDDVRKMILIVHIHVFTGNPFTPSVIYTFYHNESVLRCMVYSLFSKPLVVCQYHSDFRLIHRIFKGQRMSNHPGLKEFCTELRSSPVPSAPLLCFMVTMYEQDAMAHKGTAEGKQYLDTALEVSPKY